MKLTTIIPCVGLSPNRAASRQHLPYSHLTNKRLFDLKTGFVATETPFRLDTSSTPDPGE